jgi:hypothetical protein
LRKSAARQYTLIEGTFAQDVLYAEEFAYKETPQTHILRVTGSTSANKSEEQINCKG